MSIIAVCTPARDDVKTMFARDLVTAIGQHIATTEDIVVPLFSMGTLLPSQRSQLVLSARKESATHILFVDSDMRFPADIIARMLDADCKVVAANCARRRMPTGPTAHNYDEATGKSTKVYSTPEDHGLERVDICGTGVMLLQMSVFDEIPAPWFATPWMVDTGGYLGEDVYFCRLLAKHGIPLFIDHDLSREIGHIGTFEFKHEHTTAIRDMDAAKVEAPLVVLAETPFQKRNREMGEQNIEAAKQQGAYNRHCAEQTKGMQGYQ